MVRRTIPVDPLDPLIEATPRPVIAMGTDYPAGHHIKPHRHRRSQLLYGARGTLTVHTDQGAWVVPPERAMWIPGGTQHEVRMIGAASVRSLYIEAEFTANLPQQCAVMAPSPLMRNLLLAAVDAPLEYEPGSRAGLIMELLLHELRELHTLPLSLPLPSDARLANRCRRFLQRPSSRDTIDEWSAATGMSRRGFTRRFRQETGLSFADWRQRACVLAALPRLAAGAAITRVALDFGYDSPAAFTSMFKRVLGMPPSRYLRLAAAEELEPGGGAATEELEPGGGAATGL